MVKFYAGEVGDIVMLNFEPSIGSEIQKRRPAIIVSNKIFNKCCKVRLLCPITHTDNNFPLHIPLDDRTMTKGFILCEQVKSLDVQARQIEFIEKLPTDLLDEVQDILKQCFS